MAAVGKVFKTSILASLVFVGSLAVAVVPESAKLVPETEIITKEVNYSAGDTKMVGYVAYPKGAKNKPAVLVVHEWWGQTEYPRQRAEMLAKSGYVAMAIDMFGGRRVAEHPTEAGEFAKQTMSQMDQATRRFQAAMDFVKGLPEADPKKIAAVGYCFGGGVVLAMAARGLDLDGVVSLHGSIPKVDAPKKGQVPTKVLILNGADDPVVKKADIQAYSEKMKKAGAEVDVVHYEGAKHGFTNPEATAHGKKHKSPTAYNAEADRKSWQRQQDFLKSVF